MHFAKKGALDPLWAILELLIVLEKPGVSIVFGALKNY